MSSTKLTTTLEYRTAVRRNYFTKRYPNDTPEQIDARMARPVQHYGLTPEQRRHARRVSSIRLAATKRGYPLTDEQIEARIVAIQQGKLSGNNHPKPSPESAARNKLNRRMRTIRQRHPDWNQAQIIERIAAMDAGEIRPNGKPASPVYVKPAPKVAPPPPPTPTRMKSKKPEPEKPPKVFPSTIGQQRYVVLEREANGQGFKKPFDVLVDADKVDRVRAKYEAINAIFRGPLLA